MAMTNRSAGHVDPAEIPPMACAVLPDIRNTFPQSDAAHAGFAQPSLLLSERLLPDAFLFPSASQYRPEFRERISPDPPVRAGAQVERPRCRLSPAITFHLRIVPPAALHAQKVGAPSLQTNNSSEQHGSAEYLQGRKPQGWVPGSASAWPGSLVGLDA